ncbi:MAG: PDZ domain-containing protein [Pyrinomonadaceae bacterium]|nr:PDZ domain-containing protein [Pyrinomonadaceae bacterium]
MLHKFLILTMIALFGGATAQAQDAPVESKNRTEKTVRRVMLSAPFERSYLGIQTVEISRENFAKFGLSEVRGVGIEKVVENSPADKAGLQDGDVIIKFDGEEIKSVLKLTRLIAEVAPDQIARVLILRGGGGERELNVTLGKREFSPFSDGNFSFETVPRLRPLPRIRQLPSTPPMLPMPPMRGGENVFIWRGDASRQIGVGVTPLTKQLGDYFGVSEGKGLLINNVRENSPADKAGLKTGDVIVEADDKEVKEIADLMRVLNDKREGDIIVTIIREKNRQTVRVTPEISKDGAMKFEELNKSIEVVPNQLNL